MVIMIRITSDHLHDILIKLMRSLDYVGKFQIHDHHHHNTLVSLFFRFMVPIWLDRQFDGEEEELDTISICHASWIVNYAVEITIFCALE